MKQIKLVLINSISRYDSYEDNSWTDYIIQQGLSDWEEVSDEDFQYIRDNIGKISHPLIRQHFTVAIVIKNELPVFETIKNIKESIEQEKKRQKLEEEKYRKAREEQKAKALAKKALKNKQKLGELVELLKKQIDVVGLTDIESVVRDYIKE